MRTGEARLTRSHFSGPRHIIHAVGPKYQAKYTQAAGSALHGCYRHALQLCRAKGLRTAALLPLHDEQKKNFPPLEGAHVALRTIRRFLEQNKDAFDCVLLVQTDDDTAYLDMAYHAAMPLYFPRTEAELRRSAAGLAGRDLGDENGEIIPPEQRIRVARSLPPASPGAANGSSSHQVQYEEDDDPLCLLNGGSNGSPSRRQHTPSGLPPFSPDDRTSTSSLLEEELSKSSPAERDEFRHSFLDVTPGPDERRERERRRPASDYIGGGGGENGQSPQQSIVVARPSSGSIVAVPRPPHAQPATTVRQSPLYADGPASKWRQSRRDCPQPADGHRSSRLEWWQPAVVAGAVGRVDGCSWRGCCGGRGARGGALAGGEGGGESKTPGRSGAKARVRRLGLAHRWA